jgi:MarR family transcriptional regulator, lower aerobic nicotinate degradation pathway regulator
MVIEQLVKAPKELVKSPGFLLKRLGTIVKEKTIEAYEGGGLTPYAYGVLSVLEEGVRETQAEIADALCYDRSYLVGVLDELEQAGMIERRRDVVDRRRHVVTMTPAGKKELGKLRLLHARIDEDVFAVLTAAERKQLETLLAKVAAAQDSRFSV